MAELQTPIQILLPAQAISMPRAFKAAFNGKMYVGKVDTDPTDPTNQIQAYIENEDGTFTEVNQPIDINGGGYPVYNAQVTQFATDDEYSLAVYDSSNAIIFYYANAARDSASLLRKQLASEVEPYGAGMIGYQGGTLIDAFMGAPGGIPDYTKKPITEVGFDLYSLKDISKRGMYFFPDDSTATEDGHFPITGNFSAGDCLALPAPYGNMLIYRTWTGRTFINTVNQSGDYRGWQEQANGANTFLVNPKSYSVANPGSEPDFNTAPPNSLSFVYGDATHTPGFRSHVLDFYSLDQSYRVQLAISNVASQPMALSVRCMDAGVWQDNWTPIPVDMRQSSPFTQSESDHGVFVPAGAFVTGSQEGAGGDMQYLQYRYLQKLVNGVWTNIGAES